MRKTVDIANYIKNSKPLDGKDAEGKLDTFYKLVSDARDECGIMDVHVITMVYIHHNDKDVPGIASGHFGDSEHAGLMCMWSIKSNQAERDKAIDKMVARQS